MSETTINQRLAILLDLLKMKAPAFARAIGVSETTFRNYIDRDSKPSSEVLEKISNSFEDVNLAWLVAGKGDPLSITTRKDDDPAKTSDFFFRSPVVGKNRGQVNQQQHEGSSILHDSDNRLALAEKEIEHLKAQLESKEALLAAKEELITLLRASYNRPN